MNWVDWLIIILVGLSIIEGFREGFVRMGVGFGALIVGFLAASWFHGTAAGALAPYIASKAAASLAGYILIFVGVIVAGALIAALVAHALKIVGLSFLDRALGAAFGFVRAAIVLAVGTMILMAFTPKRLPAAVRQSELAPYVFETADVLSAATPYEIKQGFARGYAEMREVIQGLASKKRLEVREE